MDNTADSSGSYLVGHQLTVAFSHFDTNGGLRDPALAAPGTESAALPHRAAFALTETAGVS
jgi:hypothetical protein